jgi:uncharacterized protein (DUF1015 family)
MAQIAPFQPFRYMEKAGLLDDLVTQPYDKISPEMQDRYLAKSPYNLVRVILGKAQESDSPTDNVYTRAAAHLNEWIENGHVAKDPEPAIYAYFQEFVLPDSGETLTRKGFITLGAVEDYSEGTVHRHEQTLSGPKKDRRDLLEATRSHFGQIFMLYSDPECRVDAILDESARQLPVADVRDDYGTRTDGGQEAPDRGRPSPLRNSTAVSQGSSGARWSEVGHDDSGESSLARVADSRHPPPHYGAAGT